MVGVIKEEAPLQQMKLQVPTHGTGNPTIQTTTHKLSGQNFLHCSQPVKVFIKDHGRFGYLIGAIKAPNKDDPAFSTWNSENSMIMSWLIQWELEIGQTYLFLSKTKDL